MKRKHYLIDRTSRASKEDFVMLRIGKGMVVKHILVKKLPQESYGEDILEVISQEKKMGLKVFKESEVLVSPELERIYSITYQKH